MVWRGKTSARVATIAADTDFCPMAKNGPCGVALTSTTAGPLLRFDSLKLGHYAEGINKDSGPADRPTKPKATKRGR